MTIPLRSYAVIQNPVERDENGEAKKDEYGAVMLKFADTEIRFEQPRFPLYPGEELVGSVTKLRVVHKDTAIRIQCLMDFKTEAGVQVICFFVAWLKHLLFSESQEKNGSLLVRRHITLEKKKRRFLLSSLSLSSETRR